MRSLLLLAALVTVGAGATPAAATPRAFSIGGTAATTIAVAPDGAVYAASPEVAGVRRLGPADTAFRPLPVPAAATVKVTDVAVAADGAVLWVDMATHRVWRRAPDGATAPVAGLDGVCPSAIATMTSGGLLVVDNFETLRVLDPGAPLRTLWPAGNPVSNAVCFDGGNGLIDATAASDGMVYALFDPENELRAIAPDGSVAHVLAVPGAEGVDAGPDATLTITRDSGVYRWAPAAAGLSALLPLTGAGGDPIFDPDGASLPAFGAAVTVHGRAVVAPDGGIVLPVETSDELGRARVAYVPGARPGRLAVALRGRLGRVTARGYVAALHLTRPARVQVSIVRRGRTVARVARGLRAGASTVTLGRGLPFGGVTVRVDATGSDGQAARDSLRLFLGPTLSVTTARSALPSSFDAAGCGLRRRDTARAADCSADEVATTAGTCTRRGGRRVDCAYSYRYGGDRVCRQHATRATPVGTLVFADAEITCPRRGGVAPTAHWRVLAEEWGSERLP